MKTATFIRELTGWTGEARLYRLSEPLPDALGKLVHYVIVSATIAPFTGPETLIFGCDKPAEGQPSCWGDLVGSYRGGLDHEHALRGAGYEVRHPAQLPEAVQAEVGEPDGQS